MDPVALDPGIYNGTYKLIGGEISLDFVNTVSWPDTPQEHDWLDHPSNVTRWAVAAEVISEDCGKTLNGHPAALLEKELEQIHRIRRDLRLVLRPLAFDEKPTQGSIDKLTNLTHQVYSSRYIDPISHQWTWQEPSSLSQILAPVIWNATHVLTSTDHTRIGHCLSCNWIFYDTTRNRSRRWCDMADCGSRDKALRYYHRAKTTKKS